eukprot:CAMPEP_0201954038 /NCGR_PEP_ID=MMETSP0904-20121228/2165_1 /ASSEMBLY_ACC=CAM_ASM_000553 /TAXON_ID=420261 /ORGANISM="Thalassiosira antarctica, Strain CCMP982" /LENGTH=293 /DNA_ID=CAMNT_0048497991 /DNA_START=20 /DNA_END=901 /DNA_ORIENTATION=-
MNWKEDDLHVPLLDANDNEKEPEPQSNVDAGDGDDDTSKQDEKKPATRTELLMRYGALGNFVMQCLNFALATAVPGKAGSFGAFMIYGSSGLGAVHSPVVVYKERQLTKADTLRTALNGIREEQARLTEQNDILSAEIDGLQSEVDRMKDVEMALHELSETQGSQLNELLDHIKENKEINEGLRAVLKSKCLEGVITMVLDIDHDESDTIQDREIDRLIIGMDLMEGISFDAPMFRQEVIDCGGHVDEVILLIKSMIHGGDGNEDGESNPSCTIKIDQDPEEYFDKQRERLGL